MADTKLESVSPEAVALLSRVLETDERVGIVVKGSNSSALIGTDKRLFIFKKGGWLEGQVGSVGPRIAYWWHNQIRDLEYGRFPARIKIDAPVGSAHKDWKPGVLNLDPTGAKERYEELRRFVQAGARSSVAQAPSDVATTDRRSFVGKVIAQDGFPVISQNVACRVEFDAQAVTVFGLTEGGYTSVGTIPLESVRALRVGGAGAITSTSGGGWAGGGFGAQGIVTGVLLSTALNALTTRRTTAFETILHLSAEGKELMLLNEEESPEVLQVRLAPVMARLSTTGQAGAQQASSTGDPRLERLKLLGELRASGVLTEEEFVAEKARLLEDDENPG